MGRPYKRYNGKIHIAGEIEKIGDFPAGEDNILPGHQVESYRDTDGAQKWRKQLTATDMQSCFIALEMVSLGVDKPYMKDDMMNVGRFQPGSIFWGFIPSGQDIAVSEHLQSNGGSTGMFKAATAETAAANVARFRAHEEIGAVLAATRCAIEVL
jgi:hypothetical protein